jgi:ubiquitin-like 1-activating enzyme E1 A
MKETPSFFLTREDMEVKEKEVKKIKRTVADALKPKIEELNPLLGECETYTTDPSNLTVDFIQQFSIIVASHISMSNAIRIAEVTVKNGGKFFMADCFGFDAASILDLGADHTFRPEQGKTLLDETTLSQYIPLKTALLDVPLSDAVNRFHKTPIPVWIRYRCVLEYVEQKKVWPSILVAEDFVETVTKWIKESAPNLIDHIDLQPKALEQLAKAASSELAPVCSVMGGMLGNEIIKAISGKGEPANNTILFDGTSCKAYTFLVKPKDP